MKGLRFKEPKGHAHGLETETGSEARPPSSRSYSTFLYTTLFLAPKYFQGGWLEEGDLSCASLFAARDTKCLAGSYAAKRQWNTASLGLIMRHLPSPEGLELEVNER